VFLSALLFAASLQRFYLPLQLIKPRGRVLLGLTGLLAADDSLDYQNKGTDSGKKIADQIQLIRIPALG
jgi:hypothetical protein